VKLAQDVMVLRSVRSGRYLPVCGGILQRLDTCPAFFVGIRAYTRIPVWTLFHDANTLTFMNAANLCDQAWRVKWFVIEYNNLVIGSG
jgi:hypothetical protein